MRRTLKELAKLTRNQLVQEISSSIEVEERNISEEKSWRQSLYDLIQILNNGGFGNLGGLIELETPVGSRIDFVLVAKGLDDKDVLVIFENKQWSEILAYQDGFFKVNGIDEFRLSPLVQLNRYQDAFENHHSYFENENDVQIIQIANLHNLNGSFSQFFEGGTIARVFYKEQQQDIVGYLRSIICDERNERFESDLLNGEYVLGKASLDMIKDVVRRESNVELIHEQVRIADQVTLLMRRFLQNNNQRYLVVIHGAPGTGKTVLGMKLIEIFYRELADYQSKFQATYALTKNKTLKTFVNNLLGSNSSVATTLPFSEKLVGLYNSMNLKLVVGDEYHRAGNSDLTLTKLFENPKFVILLQDDRQRILPTENGTMDNIRTYVAHHPDIIFNEYQLETQKRVGTNTEFDKFLRELLFGSNPQGPFGKSYYDIDIVKNLADVDQWLFERKGQSIWLAPFDWEWISRGFFDTENKDIEINNQRTRHNMPFSKWWNPDPMKDSKRLITWLKDKSGKSLNLVGSIYTSQGLEFDYVGFIWGKDLIWDNESQRWVVRIEEIKDSQLLSGNSREFNELVKNVYYVLLSRAKKGIRIWIEDEATRKHVSSFIENYKY